MGEYKVNKKVAITREDLFNSWRQLGKRVNDLSGIFQNEGYVIGIQMSTEWDNDVDEVIAAMEVLQKLCMDYCKHHQDNELDK